MTSYSMSYFLITSTPLKSSKFVNYDNFYGSPEATCVSLCQYSNLLLLTYVNSEYLFCSPKEELKGHKTNRTSFLVNAISSSYSKMLFFFAIAWKSWVIIFLDRRLEVVLKEYFPSKCKRLDTGLENSLKMLNQKHYRDFC